MIENIVMSKKENDEYTKKEEETLKENRRQNELCKANKIFIDPKCKITLDYMMIYDYNENKKKVL